MSVFRPKPLYKSANLNSKGSHKITVIFSKLNKDRGKKECRGENGVIMKSLQRDQIFPKP